MNPAPSDKPPEPTPATSLPPLSPPGAAPQTPSALPAAPPSPPAAGPDRPPSDPVKRLFLAASAVAFFGWLAWLSYAALNKSREPIVSRAQAALAPMPVRAKVEADSKGVPAALVTVIEPLQPESPAKDAKILVSNLPAASGFTGTGEYLLLLAPDRLAILPDGSFEYHLVGPRPTTTDSEPVPIYPWSPDVAAQAKRLYPAKK
jgi:hypothetical protein